MHSNYPIANSSSQSDSRLTSTHDPLPLVKTKTLLNPGKLCLNIPQCHQFILPLHFPDSGQSLEL